MKKKIKVISSFLISFLFLALSAHADFRFEVRIVQFQPTDAPPEKVDILGLVKDAQEFYRNEMQRHGYGPKTFRVEKFAGKIRVHTVNAKHPIEYYTTEIIEKVIHEFPAEWTPPNDIYVVVINGLREIKHSNLTSVGIARSTHCGASGGVLCEAGSSPRLDFITLVHALGITFGLRHNTFNPNSIMQDGDLAKFGDGHGELSDYEARWLDKSHYFNPPPPIDLVLDPPPEIIAVNPVIVGRETIRIRVELSGHNELHQAIAMRHWQHVIGYDFLSGTKDTAHFQIEKNLLESVPFIEMLVMDIKGNTCFYNVKVDLAASVNANQKKLIPWANIKR